MNAFTPADTLHRLVKQAIDSGVASSVDEANALFRGYRLCLVIGEADVRHPAHQAALLTAVALARRVFLGGVTVVGQLDVPLAVPLPFGASLAAAVEALGGHRVVGEAAAVPCIFIGERARPRGTAFRVRAVYAGWRGGVVPAHAKFASSEDHVVPLAPML